MGIWGRDGKSLLGSMRIWGSRCVSDIIWVYDGMVNRYWVVCAFGVVLVFRI